MKIYIFLFSILCLALAAPLPTRAAEQVNLSVPFVWEIPDGAWVKPWNGACEEASMAMIENFYLNNRRIFSHTEMKKMMWPLFGIEDRLFGSNADTNSTRTLKLINDFSSFNATIQLNPTLEDITAELDAGRPVISLHYGIDLNNPKHRFRRGGSSYHVMVLTGYDEAKHVFFANDPELSNGLDYPYTYATIMASLHDFNHQTKKADGIPTVLFTSPKQIVRAEGTKRLFLIRDGKRYLILTPQVMGNHRLSWSLVKVISKTDLAAIPYGGAISE